LAEGIIQREITNRNARVGLLQDLVDRMRRVIEERGAEMADVPGGSSGLLVKTYKGKDADSAVYRFDAALVEQMNATCKQVAIEIGHESGFRADRDVFPGRAGSGWAEAQINESNQR